MTEPSAPRCAPSPAEPSIEGLPPPVNEAVQWVLGVSTYPRVPARIGELMCLSLGAEPAFAAVDRIVRADPMLAAWVLGAANSALYCSLSPVTSLRSAFLRLGWNTLRSILLNAVADLHLFAHGPRAEVEAARLHAVAVAHVHRLLAQTLGLDGEHAFACGLLHDLGTGTSLSLFAGADCPPMTHAVRRQAIDVVHGHVGARQCEIWGVPQVFADNCRLHHDATVPTPIQQVDLASVAMAEAVAHSLGFGGGERPTDPTPWVDAQPLDAVALDGFLDAAKELCSEGL